MIDEYWTWIFYGYHSDELSHGSGMPIVARCDDCCRYRVSTMWSYRDLCGSCAKKTKYLSDVARRNKSESHIGIFHIDKTRLKISGSMRGRTATNEARLNMSRAQTGRIVTDEARRRSSATKQRVSYDEWIRFASDGDYCHKFDEACREHNRDKYDRLCFICCMDEEENGQKLSVHHVDMNKNQGCDDHAWKLVPLCKSHHSFSHYDPLKSRIEWLLKNVW